MKVKLDKKPMHHNALPSTFAYAAENRDKQTEAEQCLWDAVKGKALDYRIRRQHPCGRYILDFYCHAALLGIEVDGGYHLSPEQIENDEARTAYLSDKGIHIIRFSNQEVLTNISDVLQSIASQIASRLSSEKTTKHDTDLVRKLPSGNQRVCEGSGDVKSYLAIYPNSAEDYYTIHYRLTEIDGDATLRIINSLGVVEEVRRLIAAEDQILFRNQLETGAYQIELRNAGKLVDTEKLIIK